MEPIFWIASILVVFVQTSSAEGDNHLRKVEEESCGPVPNHGQMMMVIEPMTHVIICTVNRIKDYGVLLFDIREVILRFCVMLDVCIPSGMLVNNGPTEPLNVTAVDLVVGCLMHPTLPLAKQGILSVLHWILQITKAVTG